MVFGRGVKLFVGLMMLFIFGFMLVMVVIVLEILVIEFNFIVDNVLVSIMIVMKNVKLKVIMEWMIFLLIGCLL